MGLKLFLQGQYADSFLDLLKYESRRDNDDTFRDYLHTLIEIEQRCHDTVRTMAQGVLELKVLLQISH